jgi:hypothetical protein
MKPSRPTWFPRLSPSLVVAAIALSVSLTATGYAAVVLPKNSVGSDQLKAGAVTSAKVKDGTLQVTDFGRASRERLRGSVGPVGPRGEKGDPGPAGLGGVETVGASSPFNSSPEKTLVVNCPTGKRLLGGGAGAWGRAMIDSAVGVVLTASQPLDDRTWLAAAREVNPTDESWVLQAKAVCAAVT